MVRTQKFIYDLTIKGRNRGKYFRIEQSEKKPAPFGEKKISLFVVLSFPRDVP